MIQVVLLLHHPGLCVLYYLGPVSNLKRMYFLRFSVQSCLHIMDMCQSKANSYDSLSRNKAAPVRPVTLPNTPNMSVAFNKMACVPSQVSYCLHKAMVLCVKSGKFN